MRLKQWLLHSLTPWAAATAATVVFGLLETMDGEVFGGGKYFFGICFFLLAMVQIVIYQSVLPIAISFGSTRREALTGLRLYRILSTLLCVATAVLLTWLEGDDAMMPPLTMLPCSLGLYFLGSALGGVMGKVFTKWGNNAAFLFFFVVTLLTALGLITGFIFLVGLEVFTQSFPWQYAVLGIGIAAHLLMLPFDKKLVYDYTVKM